MLQSCLIAVLANDPVVAIAQGSQIYLYLDEQDTCVDAASDRHSSQIRSMCFSPCARYLVSGGDDKLLAVSDSRTGAFVHDIRFDKKITCVAFCGSTILVADRFGGVFRVETGNGFADPVEVTGHVETISAMAVTDTYLITGDIDTKIRVCRYPSTHVIESFCLGHKEAITTMCALPSSRLVSGGTDGTIRLWDLVTGDEIGRCDIRRDDDDEPAAVVLDVAYWPSSNAVAVVASGCSVVYVLDALTMDVREKVALDSPPFSVGVDGRGRLWVGTATNLVSVSGPDREARVHDTPSKLMAARASEATCASYVFEEINRKKELQGREDRRAAKRAKQDHPDGESTTTNHE